MIIGVVGSFGNRSEPSLSHTGTSGAEAADAGDGSSDAGVLSRGLVDTPHPQSSGLFLAPNVILNNTLQARRDKLNTKTERRTKQPPQNQALSTVG